jgi:PAS domain S-box-containing protein
MPDSLSFSQLVDSVTLQKTLQQLYRAAQIPSLVVDFDGNALARGGGMRICDEFHRKHPKAAKLCRQSDRRAMREAGIAEHSALYTCPHGLFKACCPIILDGIPVAYVFTGQFLREPINDVMLERFKKQAKVYGFDEEEYLATLHELPVVSADKHREMLKYLEMLVKQSGKPGQAGPLLRKPDRQVNKSEELLRLTFDAMSDGLWDWDVPGNIVRWSPQCFRMLGYAPDDFAVTYDTWRDLIHPLDRDRAVTLLQSALAEDMTFSCEFRFKTAKDDYLWVLGRGKAVEYDSHGAIQRIVGTHTDISKMRTAEEMFEKVFAGSPIMMAISEISSGRFLKVNHYFEKITGYSRELAVGHRSTDLGLIAREDRHRLVRSINSDGQIPGMELCMKKADGEQFPAFYSGVLVDIGGQQHLLSLVHDLSDKKQAEAHTKQLEKQLQQAQKLEAIGTLAGGIAHDFNNILGVMIGFTDMVLDDVPQGSRIRTDLEKVLRAGYRGKDLVGQILAFSRQSQDECIPLQLRLIIKEVLKMLRSSLPTTIKIKQKLDVDCGPVEADPSQIHQILMNLCTNAYHAMEEHGGVLTIEFRPAQRLPAGLDDQVQQTGGRFLELIVSDTGVGIPGDIIDLIFDPFYTTKAKGKGTGMGLSIAYGIVKKYNGTITVESVVGSGTAFHIYLPESIREVVEFAAAEELVAVGKGHILLIDDEQLLVEMGKTMLERLGYTVNGLTDSRQALEVFSDSPDDFDLVITDQTMPDLTGLELAGAMLRIRPSLPIILCTGYSSRVNEEVAKKHGIRSFLYKPIVKGNIAQVMRDIFADN